MFTTKVATFMSHELACPGMSWLSSFSAFGSNVPCLCLFSVTPHLLELSLAFAQFLTQVSDDMGESGGRLQDAGPKKWFQWPSFLGH